MKRENKDSSCCGMINNPVSPFKHHKEKKRKEKKNERRKIIEIEGKNKIKRTLERMFAEVTKLNKITDDEVYRDTRAIGFEDTISAGFIGQTCYRN